MQFARCTGLWDAALYDFDRDDDVRSGGLAMADRLRGDDINWAEFTLDSYRPRGGQRILECTRTAQDIQT